MSRLIREEINAAHKLMTCAPRIIVNCPPPISAKLSGEVEGDYLSMDALWTVFDRDTIPVLFPRDFDVSRVGHHPNKNAILWVHGCSRLSKLSSRHSFTRFKDALVNFSDAPLMLLPPCRIGLCIQFFVSFTLMLHPIVIR